MANKDPKATFAIDLEGTAGKVAEETAGKLEGLHKSIIDSESAIRDMSQSLKRLSNSSADTKKAKEELTAKIKAEKQAIEQANLAILKEGSSLDKLNKRKKEEKTATDAEKKATDESAKSSLAFADAVGGTAVAAILAVEGALIGATIAFAKFVIESQSAQRTSQLFMLATVQTADNAQHLGEQVDSLAKKVPLARTELQAMATEMGKNGIRGQALVDELNAVAQATSALGAGTGAKVQELIERNRLVGNFSLSPQELLGTGLSGDAVANALAENMNIGVDAARNALFNGQVKLADGAAALRKAVEGQTKAVNLALLKDPVVAFQKFKETLQSLTRDINIEPLLTGLSDFFELFDSEKSTTGAVIKDLVTGFGTDLVAAITASLPIAKNLIRGLILGALNIKIAWLSAEIALKKAIHSVFGEPKTKSDIDSTTTAIKVGKIAIEAMAVAVVVLAGTLALALTPLITIGALLYGAYKIVTLVVDAFEWLDDATKAIGDDIWDAGVAVEKFGEKIGGALFEELNKLSAAMFDAGKAVVDGFVRGLTAGGAAIKAAAHNMTSAVKNEVKDTLGIHSPSTVARDYGQRIPEGLALGIDDRAPQAVNAMAKAIPELGAGGSGGARGGDTKVEVTFNIQGSNAKEIAKEISSPSVLEPLRKVIQEAMLARGIPVPQ